MVSPALTVPGPVRVAFAETADAVTANRVTHSSIAAAKLISLFIVDLLLFLTR